MKLRQYFVKLKISKSFNTGKWDRCIEYFARLFVLASVIVLAMWTIFTSPLGITWFAKAFLIIFISAAAIVFYFEARHLFRKQPSNQQESTQIPTDIERAGRNKWISIGLLVLVAIVIGLFFLAQQLPATTRGYQTFFTAFAGFAALGTGIAIAVFAYQQYRLRQTEHGLLFTPHILLTSGDISTIGSTRDRLFIDNRPFQIKWTVFIQNTSNIPILIEHMAVYVKLFGKDPGRLQALEGHCRVVDPADLTIPFEVTLAKPQYVTWIVEGSDSFGSAGDAFDIVSIDSDKRIFVLIASVSVRKPRDLKEPASFKETVSSRPIHVPKDANWVSKTPFLDKYMKNQKGEKTA